MDKHVLLSRITTREKGVIRLLAQGLTTKQIAQKLKISTPFELRCFILEDNEEEKLQITSKFVAKIVHTVEKVFLTKTETNHNATDKLSYNTFPGLERDHDSNVQNSNTSVICNPTEVKDPGDFLINPLVDKDLKYIINNP